MDVLRYAIKNCSYQLCIWTHGTILSQLPR